VADQAAQAVHDRRAFSLTLIVVSGAVGTGKSTIAAALGAALRFPVLSLDPVKEALADVLGPGDEDWSDVMNPAIADRVGFLAATVTPLGLGAAQIEVDTGTPGASKRAVTAVRALRLR
jgi:adenylylsulfate kinase-like enzyme